MQIFYQDGFLFLSHKERQTQIGGVGNPYNASLLVFHYFSYGSWDKVHGYRQIHKHVPLNMPRHQADDDSEIHKINCLRMGNVLAIWSKYSTHSIMDQGFTITVARLPKACKITIQASKI